MKLLFTILFFAFTGCIHPGKNNSFVSDSISTKGKIITVTTKPKIDTNDFSIPLSFMLTNEPSHTKIGILFNQLTNDPRVIIRLLKDYGVVYAKTLVTISNFNNASLNYSRYIDSGINVLLNINYEPSDPPGHFVTDTIFYKFQVAQILDRYWQKPVVVVIENEETTAKYRQNYSAALLPVYIKQLKCIIPVIHARRLKVTNGGGPAWVWCRDATYRYYFNKGMKAFADSFAVKAKMDRGIINRALKGYDKVNEVEYLFSQYKNLNLDYINVHFKDPIPEAFPYVVQYIKSVTGKPMIDNEVGQTRIDSTQVRQILDAYTKAKIDYAIWYSGDGIDGAVGLIDPVTLTDRINGIAFKNYIKRFKQ